MLKVFKIDNEGHTVGCMLRKRLFDQNAEFVACTLQHPQDQHLTITVQSNNPKATVLDAIAVASQEIDDMIKYVSAYIIFKDVS